MHVKGGGVTGVEMSEMGDNSIAGRVAGPAQNMPACCTHEVEGGVRGN